MKPTVFLSGASRSRATPSWERRWWDRVTVQHRNRGELDRLDTSRWQTVVECDLSDWARRHPHSVFCLTADRSSVWDRRRNLVSPVTLEICGTPS